MRLRRALPLPCGRVLPCLAARSCFLAPRSGSNDPQRAVEMSRDFLFHVRGTYSRENHSPFLLFSVDFSIDTREGFAGAARRHHGVGFIFAVLATLPTVPAESSTFADFKCQQVKTTAPPLQRASPMKLSRLYQKMTPEQMKLISDAHYGGLESIKCSKLQPELCKFLMKFFNPVTCELVFPGRGKIPVTESSVQKVIGVAHSEVDVRYGLDASAVKFMNEKMGNRRKTQSTIVSLEEKLAGMTKADSSYLRLFILYGMCSVVAPNTSTRVTFALSCSLACLLVEAPTFTCPLVEAPTF